MSENNSSGNEKHDRARHESYQRTYSLAQIAQKLDRPASTIRTWKDQYNEYVESSSIGKGRNKRYTGDAVQIFSLINEMKERNEPHELIQRTLAENVDQIVYTPDEDDHPPALMNEILDSFKSIAEVMSSQEDQIKLQNEQLKSQDEQIKELEAYIKESDSERQQREAEREQRESEREQRMTETIAKLSQQLEQQQESSKESTKKHDEASMELLRNSQEINEFMKGIAEEVAAATEKEEKKSFFARLLGK